MGVRGRGNRNERQKETWVERRAMGEAEREREMLTDKWRETHHRWDWEMLNDTSTVSKTAGPAQTFMGP